ncbi:MAG: hypothetical protein J7M21_05460, partial [Planctomycetes bacterium]|nr:hypothetical protein [Planctomycetota bacterium]
SLSVSGGTAGAGDVQIGAIGSTDEPLDVTVDVNNNGTATFAAIDMDGALAVTNATTATFGGAVGATDAPASLTVTGVGTLAINGAITTGGDVNITVSNPLTIDENLTSGGATNITVTADDTGAGATLTLTAGDQITSTAGALTIVADDMDISGTINAAGQRVTLRSNTAGDAVDLGSATAAAAGTLELSDAELDNVTAATLVIGSASQGAISVTSGGISTPGYDVELVSAGSLSINQPVSTSGGTFTATIATGVTSTAAGTITTTHTVAGAASGAVAIQVTGTGDVALAGAIDTSGLDNAAGAGSAGGDVNVYSPDGSVQVASVDTSGGDAGGGNFNGGDAGSITLLAWNAATDSGGSVTATGDLLANGGDLAGTGAAGAGGNITLQAGSEGTEIRSIVTAQGTFYDWRPDYWITLGDGSATVRIQAQGGNWGTASAGAGGTVAMRFGDTDAGNLRDRIPSTATIVGRVPSGGSVGITGGAFIMGHDDNNRLAAVDGDHEKFTSLGNLWVNVTGKARLGDMTAAGALTVHANTVEFIGRGPGAVLLAIADNNRNLVADSDLDYIASSINVTQGGGGFVYLNGATPTASSTAFFGSFPGGVQVITAMPTLVFTDAAHAAPDGTNNWILDAAAGGSLLQPTNLATALAGAIAAPTPQVTIRGADFTGEERLALVRHLGIRTRDPKAAELLDFLAGRKFMADPVTFKSKVSSGEPYGPGGQPSQYVVLIDRISGTVGRQALAQYRSIYWRQEYDQKTNKPRWVSLAPEIRRVLEKTVNAYKAGHGGKFDPRGYRAWLLEETLKTYRKSPVGKAGLDGYGDWLAQRNEQAYRQAHGGKFDPADYWKWLLAKGDAVKESQYIISRLASLFAKVDELGLGPVELNVSRQTLIRPIKPRGVEVQQMIQVVTASVAPKAETVATK